MTVSYSTTLRNARADAITTAVGNAGKLRIYNGTRPSFGGAGTTLLAEFTLGSPFAAGAAGGVLSPTLPSNVTASGTGTATWWRVTQSNGTTVVEDGDVGTDMTLTNTNIASGQTVAVSSWSVTGSNA